MAIPNVEDEIYQYAKTYIMLHSLYSPKILKRQPEFSSVFPLILIREINNPLYKENLNKTDQMFKIEYEVEIYAVDTTTTMRETIINELKGLVNDVFDEHYGMNRKACNPSPNADVDVQHVTMRFNALIDENNRIYRR